MQTIPNISCHRWMWQDGFRLCLTLSRLPSPSRFEPTLVAQPLLLFFTLLSPGEEFLKGFGPLGLGSICCALGRCGCSVLHCSQLLRGQPVSIPARHFCRQVDVFPLGMKRRLLELIEPLEIILDEALQSPCPITAFGKVVD